MNKLVLSLIALSVVYIGLEALTCSTDDDCSGGQICYILGDCANGTCTCYADQVWVNETCELGAAFGASCSGEGSGNCKTQGASCNTTCICPQVAGYDPITESCVNTNGKTILNEYNADCSGSDTICNVNKGFVCNNNSVCACNSAMKNSDGICIYKDLGDPCTVDADCQGVYSAECTNQTCQCQTGETAGTVWPIQSYGDLVQLNLNDGLGICKPAGAVERNVSGQTCHLTLNGDVAQLCPSTAKYCTQCPDTSNNQNDYMVGKCYNSIVYLPTSTGIGGVGQNSGNFVVSNILLTFMSVLFGLFTFEH
ncbi:unnamed protein product [Owenia fusiformis]|uniref:Uncharacterized protein n=1 Tax=Owenia fusiformis TaxID=6347 RepID=A0A8J1TRN9_OWEFU|nr:unnamed protein product [Owenia fusiformis]